ncbi:hypothetical protein A7P85_00360 [Eikenella corrodens]|uniref:DUF3630 family protein n=1 Tax=Eikenella corrodens TaxID=539 RepID=A0A1A9RIM5_EIKCO|nr:hypothetical protein [Eikenella corrodens]OAM18175.1 hypothetical protein A7P85_00360 [Eikenella corrodens]OAM24434.1 hypothetical protein A7P92_03860 [Eikenella corrodens]DAT61992.1 MAG TPA: hypothetical protein [Caudoviricetes sp.]
MRTPFKLNASLWELPSAHAGDISSQYIDTALRQHPCIHLSDCALAPNADMWTITFQGNDFIVVNDLADGLSIRFSDSAQTDLAEKLLAIIEPPKAT